MVAEPPSYERVVGICDGGEGGQQDLLLEPEVSAPIAVPEREQRLAWLL
jgi:hypothetical protein